MPVDETGNEYHDLIAPGGPARPLDQSRPPDVARIVAALAKQTPEQQRAFLQSRKQQMDPESYRRSVAALVKAGYQQQTGTNVPGNNHTEGEIHGPSGTFFPDSPLPRRPGPAPSDDPSYQQVLQRSGVEYGSQQYINDPTKR